jgi:ATP-binding cassette subfamily F protein uup
LSNKETRGAEAKPLRQHPPKSVNARKPTSEGPRRRSFKETKELEQLDSATCRNLRQQALRIGSTNCAATVTTSPHEASNLPTLISTIEQAREERWLELSELAP